MDAERLRKMERMATTIRESIAQVGFVSVQGNGGKKACKCHEEDDLQRRKGGREEPEVRG